MAEQIIIDRIFDAPVETVWHAWTTPEIIQKWWGPEHFTAPSIKIDFQVGGKYIYAMRGPKESQWDKDMYSAGVFKEIVYPSTHSTSSGQAVSGKIVVTDYFSDENGEKVKATSQGLNDQMPDEMTVEVRFETIEDGKTKLSIVYSPETEAQYQGMIKSGMQEGWSTSLDKLAEAVKTV